MAALQRIAQWFAALGGERRAAHRRRCTPKSAASSRFPLGERAFTLSGSADRIEQRKDGSYAILDYKTGAPRTEKQVRTGLAPQLTLEAAILRGGGFQSIPPAARSPSSSMSRCTAASRPASRTRSNSRTARPMRRPTTRWRG